MEHKVVVPSRLLKEVCIESILRCSLSPTEQIVVMHQGTSSVSSPLQEVDLT